MFEEPKKESFAERELRILHFWKMHHLFARSLELRKEGPLFTFYDGPPFATGLPHYGHMLASTLKDVVPRYKTMKGYFVPRRFGWDCHGLPVENEVEKSSGLSGAPSIEAFGIAPFNEACRKIVLRYTEEWKSKIERLGRWVDFSETWKTMDLPFMETVWWVFKQVYEKGLIYEGFKVMPFSAKLGTPLSNFEAAENYKTVDDPSLVVALPLDEEPETALLIWTTTPWTLVSNMAVMVGEEIEYVKVSFKGKYYIVAAATVPRWFKEEGRVVATFPGKALLHKKYKPPFAYFHNQERAFRVIGEESVSTEEGTGLVHAAPAFGESDFYACKKWEIPLVCPVDNNGRFTTEVPEYTGLFVKEADKPLIRRLKEAGLLFYQGTVSHRYPFCWRSDTPLIYKAITTWFLRVEAIKEKLIAANDTVHWVPAHLKEGRFGTWLEGARDWAISRNRYWGTPIPLWRSAEGDIHVVGSVAELEQLTKTPIKDLHRHFIDSLTFVKEGKTFRRIPEVFDCWFDAGSMPYAQNHYPFENKELTEKNFPADFIAEGVDQTRGWFYTLLVLSVALFNKPAYKNVIANGILLAEDGNKMSKRLSNYPEPDLVINKYGADAVRLYMLDSPAVKAEDLRFSEGGVELVLRQILIPLWNAHLFFTTYARIYHWSPGLPREKTTPPLIDRWILAQLHRLIYEVEAGMDKYELSSAVEPLVGFVDQLTNWFIRRSRRRFWADEESADRRHAFQTLYEVLHTFCAVAAPFIPFISEAIYLNLRTPEMPLSIHLTDYPQYDAERRDPLLEKGMETLQLLVSLGHSLRKEHKLKVRQPLQTAHVVCSDKELVDFLQDQVHLIADELNVKEVRFHKENEELVTLSAKPNFRILGKKFGKRTKEVQQKIEALSQEEVRTLIHQGSLSLDEGDEALSLMLEDVDISRKAREGWIALHAGALTIALDTTLTEPLILEGFSRELVNKINTMRRNANFSVTDRIHVQLSASERVRKSLAQHETYVREEVLAIDIRWQHHPDSTPWDINGEPATIFIEKA